MWAAAFRCGKQLSEPSKPNWLNGRRWRSLSGFARAKTGSTDFAARSLRKGASELSLPPIIGSELLISSNGGGAGGGRKLRPVWRFFNSFAMAGEEIRKG